MKLAVLRGLLNLGLSLVVLKQVLLREPGQPLQVLSQKGKLGFNTLPVCFVPSQPTPYYTTLALMWCMQKKKALGPMGRSEEASWAHQTMRVRAADRLVENPNESPEDVTTKTLAYLVA